MPALRNRSHLTNGHSKEPQINGFTDHQVLSNKKLLFLEEQTNNNNNDNNNIYSDQKQSNNQEETFMDMSTMEGHAKFNHTDEDPIIFSSDSMAANRTVKDQFALALLNLQAGLDATTSRLAAIETKVDSAMSRQQQQSRTSAQGRNSKGGLFTKENLTTLVYLSWPVVVFFAIRAIERRSMANKMV